MTQVRTVERREEVPQEIVPTAVYSIAGVQALLDISRKTVLRLIEERRLPASRVGRQYRVPGACLLEFLTRSSTDPDRTQDAIIRYATTPATLLLSLRETAPEVSETQAARDALAAIARVRSRRRR